MVLIRALVSDLEDTSYTITILSATSQVRIEGNEKANILPNLISRITICPVNKITFFDLIPYLHKVFKNAWRHQWKLHTATVLWFKLFCPEIPQFPWFIISNLSKLYITAFPGLVLGIHRFPHTPIVLILNSSTFCSHHYKITVVTSVIFFISDLCSQTSLLI